MNERIQELAEQAGAIKCHGYIPHPELDGHLIWSADAALDTEQMDAEKFAELIVRECAKVVFEKTGPKSALNVLEHFGVEE
jgi:hypothetical protein